MKIVVGISNSNNLHFVDLTTSPGPSLLITHPIESDLINFNYFKQSNQILGIMRNGKVFKIPLNSADNDF